MADNGFTLTWKCEGCGRERPRTRAHHAHQPKFGGFPTTGWVWVKGSFPRPAPPKLSKATALSLLAGTVLRFSEARGRPS